jgi:hypothetical protein
MNKNYQAGRRAEYECMKRWRAKDYIAVRSAGSHGPWDVCAVRWDRPTELIQCKVTESETVAKGLLKAFKTLPPFTPSRYFHQVLEVKVKGSKEVMSVTV